MIFYLLLLLLPLSLARSSDLMIAVRQKDMPHIEWLLSEGANPDFVDDSDTSSGWTPLISATSNGQFEIVDRFGNSGTNAACYSLIFCQIDC